MLTLRTRVLFCQHGRVNDEKCCVNSFHEFHRDQVLNYAINYARDVTKLPPGPVGVPIFGYLPFLTMKPFEKLLSLTSKYGPVIGLRLGPTNVVAINGWPAVEEVLSKEQLLDRQHPRFTEFFDIPPTVGDISGALH